MADPLVQADGSSGIGNTEFYLKQVLTGDAEVVRARLVEALEALNYRVLGGQPLRAKRSARGLGALYVSADVLDYPTTLTIALKPLGAGATLVTLDYEVTHAGAVSTKGDRQTLRREAEAILALAAAHAFPTSCRACGASHAGDSQFCRLCGTRYAAGEPAELEVLRLTAGARAGQHLNAIGIVCGGAILLLSLLLVSFTSAGMKLGFVILALGEAVALLILSFGAWYLHRTLNRQGREELRNAGARRSLPPERYDYYTPALRTSVTEGTTDLLEAQTSQRAPAELGRERPPFDPTE